MDDDLSIFTIEDLQEMIESAEEMLRIEIKKIDDLPPHEQPAYIIKHINDLKIKIGIYISEIESRQNQSNKDSTKGNHSVVNIIKDEFKEPQNHMNPIKKILILAANPGDTDQLRLDKEVRAIKESLRRAKHREQFDIRSEWAISFEGLRRALLDYEPQIVHFSGHGDEDGLVLEGELELAEPIPSEALSRLFELCSKHIECVILNACYSASQAAAINKHINYVIGMPGKINDKAAIKFSVGFYDALGAGENIEEAFKFGCNAVEQAFPNLPEHLMPLLKKGKGKKEKGASTQPLNAGTRLEGDLTHVEVERGVRKKIDIQTIGSRRKIMMTIKNVLVIINPFWVISLAILAPPALCFFLNRDCTNLHGFIMKELFIFWGIFFLVFLFLVLGSYSQLKKMAEKVKREGMSVTIKEALFQLARGMMKRPLGFISQLFLFLSFYPVIMESYYCFQKHLKHYYLYESLILLTAFFGITFIHVKPEKLFKKKLAGGLKILIVALLSFLFFFSNTTENNGGQYFEWVDRYLFSGLVKNTSTNMESYNNKYRQKKTLDKEVIVNKSPNPVPLVVNSENLKEVYLYLNPGDVHICFLRGLDIPKYLKVIEHVVKNEDHYRKEFVNWLKEIFAAGSINIIVNERNRWNDFFSIFVDVYIDVKFKQKNDTKLFCKMTVYIFSPHNKLLSLHGEVGFLEKPEPAFDMRRVIEKLFNSKLNFETIVKKIRIEIDRELIYMKRLCISNADNVKQSDFEKQLKITNEILTEFSSLKKPKKYYEKIFFEEYLLMNYSHYIVFQIIDGKAWPSRNTRVLLTCYPDSSTEEFTLSEHIDFKGSARIVKIDCSYDGSYVKIIDKEYREVIGKIGLKNIKDSFRNKIYVIDRRQKEGIL
jgi:hypothetical protein